MQQTPKHARHYLIPCAKPGSGSTKTVLSKDTVSGKVLIVQDVIARFKEQHSDFTQLPDKAVFTMNDTHPTIAVAELMRLLIDQEGLDWDTAWGITVKVGFPSWDSGLIPS